MATGIPIPNLIGVSRVSLNTASYSPAADTFAVINIHKVTGNSGIGAKVTLTGGVELSGAVGVGTSASSGLDSGINSTQTNSGQIIMDSTMTLTSPSASAIFEGYALVYKVPGT